MLPVFTKGDMAERLHFVSCINLAFAIGGMIGAFGSGFAVDWVGRIRTIIFCEILMLVTFAGYLVKGETCLLLTRVASGMASGILVHTDMVVNVELIPKSISPASGLWFQGGITFGI
jgi:predicted MFS family arabinose efflux permease